MDGRVKVSVEEGGGYEKTQSGFTVTDTYRFFDSICEHSMSATGTFHPSISLEPHCNIKKCLYSGSAVFSSDMAYTRPRVNSLRSHQPRCLVGVDT